MRKNLFMFILLLPCMWCVSSCKQQGKKTDAHTEKTDVVKKVSLNDKLFFSGVISPISQSVISAPSAGSIKAMGFSYGQKIEKGQKVFVLQSPQMQKEYDAALTTYLKAKDSLMVAEGKFTGTEELWKYGLIARNAYESEQSALSSARISLYQAEQGLALLLKQSNTEEEMRLLQKLKISDTKAVEKALSKKLNQINLYAKQSGIALKPPSNAGEGDKKIQLGSQVKESEVLVLIGDLSGISLPITISEIDIDKVYKGMKAHVESVAYPDIVLEGEISEISEQASVSSGMSSGLPTFTAKVIVPTLNEKAKKVMRVGMSVKVELKTQSDSALVLDVDALYQKHGQNYVHRKVGDAVTEVAVETGRVDNGHVVIVSGLKEGDKATWQVARAN